MITLYGMGSPNVVKVLIALEELDVPFDFEHVDVIQGEQFTDEFGRLTPNRKVPVLIDHTAADGPLTLWESGAILIYLAERCGRFLPAEPNGRYLALQWLMFQMASIGPMCGQLSHFRIYAPQDQHAYSRDRYATEVKRIYDVVNARLQESLYLAGHDYTIADMAAWPWIRSTDLRGIDLSRLPAVARWIEDIGSRDAVKRAERFIASFDNSEAIRIIEEGGESLDRYLGRGAWSRPKLS